MERGAQDYDDTEGEGEGEGEDISHQTDSDSSLIDIGEVDCDPIKITAPTARGHGTSSLIVVQIRV